MSKFIKIDTREVAVDQEGFLKSLDDWDEEVATQLALEENITLDALHWEVIKLLRSFYQRHQISPATRALVRLVQKELGNEKGRSVYLMKLFSGSPAKIASKISGLPKPDNCI
jgi:tRNA 2-thiouridine synthesizing protein E